MPTEETLEIESTVIAAGTTAADTVSEVMQAVNALHVLSIRVERWEKPKELLKEHSNELNVALIDRS